MMTDEMRVAFIHSQCVCAQAELLGMQASNQQRESLGQAQAYDELAFFEVAEKYMLTRDQVLDYLAGA